MPGTVTLTVRQIAIDNRSPVCSVDYTNGSCIGLGPSGICSCDNDTNKYIITLNVTDRQKTSWLLKTSGTGISDDSMTVTVSVQYPSEIVNLTIENDGKAVTETSPAIIMNTAVNISCQWKEGNPPDPPQLSRDGVVLSTNTSVKRGSLRHVSHVIHHVLCNDTGIISCEAAGASSNKSQMLHVKCEPLIADRKITFLASSKDKTLKFPVTAFHHHVVTCQLQRYKATENVPSSLPSDCTSKASLSGSVPNLTLTIQLPEGTSQMKGRWRLDLRNGDENGSVYFTIENNNPEPSRVPIGAVIVPIVVIVVVVIVVIVAWRQRFIHKV
ncbi:uncharacterized protein [Littorina saxatilis]|uniref:uncharacterized protein n=1 Tax=Littorina saxatilis TaxID=31220 RepID=UPI0038B41FA1